MSYSSKLNYNFYLKNAYQGNRDAIRSDYRLSHSEKALISADAAATKKICKTLGSQTYDSAHALEIVNNTKVFVKTYNNLLSSSDTCSSNSVTRLKNKLSKMTKEEKASLASIGIEIKSNGELKLDEAKFGSSKPAKIKKILSSDSSFTKSVREYASQIYRAANHLTEAYTSTGSKKTNTQASSSSVNISV